MAVCARAPDRIAVLGMRHSLWPAGMSVRASTAHPRPSPDLSTILMPSDQVMPAPRIHCSKSEIDGPPILSRCFRARVAGGKGGATAAAEGRLRERDVAAHGPARLPSPGPLHLLVRLFNASVVATGVGKEYSRRAESGAVPDITHRPNNDGQVAFAPCTPQLSSAMCTISTTMLDRLQ